MTILRAALGILVLMAYTAAGPLAADTLRVGLFRVEPPTTLRVTGPCTLHLGSGRQSRVEPGKSLTLRCSGRGVLVQGAGSDRACSSVRIKPVGADGTITLVFKDEPRPYHGELVVSSSSGKLLVVNRVDVEEYLQSVVPCEMPRDWPAQALAAQAVAARSFALAGSTRHADEGFDLCDGSHCQVYRGASWERPETDAAVGMTAGQVLTFAGKCIAAPYHSTCGGRTTDGLYSGHPPEPFLRPVADVRAGKALCAESPHFEWSCSLSPDDLKRALAAGGHPAPGDISGLRVLDRDPSGRAALVEVKGAQPVRLSAYDLMIAVGRRLGWNKVKSTHFDVSKSDGKFVFAGKGLGHGMGLCQWGARGMAEDGGSYAEVLAHYLPKCVIGRE